MLNQTLNMMNNSFYNYEVVYEYLDEFLEGFNSTYDYKVRIESFLEGSIDSIGMFSKTGLYIFFKLKEDMEKTIVVKETAFHHIINILINPNNLPSFKLLSNLLLKQLINHYSVKEFIKNAKCKLL